MPSKQQLSQTKAGFTIIEVVLVLAIAGLIFLMVFVALPALQRSQRDTARRNDMSRVDTSLVQYMTNNQSNKDGQLPKAGVYDGTNFTSCNTSACDFVRQYMNSGSGNVTTNEFKDPDGSDYKVVITENIYNPPAGGVSTTSISGIGSLESKDGKYTIKESVTAGDKTSNAFDAHVVYIIPGSTCDGPAATKATSENHFSVLYRLEGAGVYCIDDQ